MQIVRIFDAVSKEDRIQLKFVEDSLEGADFLNEPVVQQQPSSMNSPWQKP